MGVFKETFFPRVPLPKEEKDNLSVSWNRRKIQSSSLAEGYSLFPLDGIG